VDEDEFNRKRKEGKFAVALHSSAHLYISMFNFQNGSSFSVTYDILCFELSSGSDLFVYYNAVSGMD
jgi:hypothetical protein